MKYNRKEEIDWTKDFVILCPNIETRNKVIEMYRDRGCPINIHMGIDNTFPNVVWRARFNDFSNTGRHTSNFSHEDPTIESHLILYTTVQGDTKIRFNFLGKGTE